MRGRDYRKSATGSHPPPSSRNAPKSLARNAVSTCGEFEGRLLPAGRASLSSSSLLQFEWRYAQPQSRISHSEIDRLLAKP